MNYFELKEAYEKIIRENRYPEITKQAQLNLQQLEAEAAERKAREAERTRKRTFWEILTERR